MNHTEMIKRAMYEVWNFAPIIMEEHIQGDKEFTNYYLAAGMTNSVTLRYKYTVDSEQILSLKEKVTIPVAVLVQPYGPKLGCASPYMEITVCYNL